MESPSPDMKALFEQALHYDRAGDIYNAIKLYKHVAKHTPHWAPPFERLGTLYKYRQDWKAALHYIKKSVALNPGNQKAWWDLGIAATALKRWRIAKNVWSKFGLHAKPVHTPEVASLRLRVDNQFEVVAARILDPARAMIVSIPFPNSNYRFKDIVLYDRQIVGHYIVSKRKLPVYDELGMFKHSVYQTASCVLPNASEADLQSLEDLCKKQDIGFEVWSNAQLNSSNLGKGRQAEYYHDKNLSPAEHTHALIGLSARNYHIIHETLESWEVIQLKSYEDLMFYHNS